MSRLTHIDAKKEVFMNQLDTIAAISTPYGKGGIAVLRVSGNSIFAKALHP